MHTLQLVKSFAPRQGQSQSHVCSSLDLPSSQVDLIARIVEDLDPLARTVTTLRLGWIVHELGDDDTATGNLRKRKT